MRQALHTMPLQAMTSGRVLLAALAMLVACSAQPALAQAPAPVLENRTYSPLHYRTKVARGAYSDWKILLPGDTWEQDGARDLAIEIWFDDKRTERYDLAPGTTYGLVRSGPRAEPEFLECESRAWRAPAPPGAPPQYLLAHAPHASVSKWVEAARSSGAPAASPFVALERFLAVCQRDQHSCRLSLKQLAADCTRAQKEGSLPQELRLVRGFTWFFGYMVDDQNDDVILLGVKDRTRPPIDVDCLASAIKAVEDGTTPYCSLDETGAKDLRKAVVAGVPWKTRYAEVMIKADHDMGSIATGLLKPGIPGFKSKLDHFADIISTMGPDGELERNAQGDWMYAGERWWFNFDSDVARAVADTSGKLLYLHKNPIRLSTERKVNGSFGSGQTFLSSRRFVEDFTRHLEAIGKQYPSIGELQALFRLYDLFRHLREVGQTRVPAADYWTSSYQHPYEGPPATMPKAPATIKVRMRADVPRLVAGASFSGTEDLPGYNVLHFQFHGNGRVTMLDADGATQGTCHIDGSQVTLRFHNGSVVYHGAWTERSLSGAATNGKRIWSWKMTMGFEPTVWTFQ